SQFLPADFMNWIDVHNHGIPSGTQLMTAGGGTITWSPSGAHAHSMYSVHHTHEIASHTHGMDHTHGMNHTYQIASHSHGMHQTRSMPHTHDLQHTHPIPAHTHEIEYGIFEGPTPTAVTVKVDGNVVPGLGTSVDEVDIIPYLAKDSGGKIQRGTW